MLPNPINQRVPAPPQSPVQNDEPGDISESHDTPPEMQYIKDFVNGLDETEFAYMQDCISAKLNGEDRPEYKAPEDVKETMDEEGANRADTENVGSGSDETY